MTAVPVKLKCLTCFFLLALITQQSCTDNKLRADHKSTKKNRSWYHVSFDHHAPGKYSGKRVRSDWPTLEWEHCQRAQVVSNNGPVGFEKGNALRVKYPAGKIGSRESGAQFRLWLKPKEEYYFEYYVRFGHGNGSRCDFSRGGKLPGLAGGTCNTGGRKTTGDGWSARYMWREEGALVLYLYHLDQKSRYGDQIPINHRLKPGKWYRLTQRIRLNKESRRNGLVQVWVDGVLKLERNDIRFRLGNQAAIDRCLFETFYGGSDKSWAPKQESLIYFDELRIQPTPVANLLPH